MNPWAVVVLLLLAAALVALVEYGSRRADRADREWFAEQERSREDRRGGRRGPHRQEGDDMSADARYERKQHE